MLCYVIKTENSGDPENTGQCFGVEILLFVIAQFLNPVASISISGADPSNIGLDRPNLYLVQFWFEGRGF